MLESKLIGNLNGIPLKEMENYQIRNLLDYKYKNNLYIEYEEVLHFFDEKLKHQIGLPYRPPQRY